MQNDYDTIYRDVLTDEGLRKSIGNLLGIAQKLVPVSMSAVAFPHTAHMLLLGASGLQDIFFDGSDSLLPADSRGPHIVANAAIHPLHADNALVVGELGVRFFASVPAMGPGAEPIALLCVMSRQPVIESDIDISALELLAAQLASRCDDRRQVAYLRHAYNENRRVSEAEQAIERQKIFYENILNSLPIDIAVFDAEHKYRFVTPGAISDEALREYIIGKDDFDYCRFRNRDIAVAEQRRAMFLDIKKTGKTLKWEDTIANAAGEAITHLRRFYPVYDEQGNLTMVIGFGMDITDRKHLEDKQTALLHQLTVNNTQLVDFCNIISHNLRAPLANISMLVELIIAADDITEQKELLALVQPSLTNVQTTLDELVESLQVSQNKDIVLDVNNMDSCLQKVLAGVQVQLTKAGAIVETDFSDAPEVKFPSRYLDSIFLNLVSNAIKYQSPDRPLQLKLKTVRADKDIILSVADNGLGIDLDRNRDKMFKIGKVFHKHPQAKGFGLFMTKSQVDAMNGEIWLESKPDAGTTFFIRFTNQ